MTQEEALQICKELLPEKSSFLTLERTHAIGFAWGGMDEFYVWDHTNRNCNILAKSETSWEHAVALVRAKAELFEQDSSPLEAA